MSPEILAFENIVLSQIKSLEQSPRFIPYNISREERIALNQLYKNREITIQPADKGGAIIIQDTSDYETEIYRQLNDARHYKTEGGSSQ